MFVCPCQGHVACFDPRTRNRVGFLDCTAPAITDNTEYVQRFVFPAVAKRTNMYRI